MNEIIEKPSYENINLPYDIEVKYNLEYISEVFTPEIERDNNQSLTISPETMQLFDETFLHATTAVITLGERLIVDRKLDKEETADETYDYCKQNGLTRHMLQEIPIEAFIDQAYLNLKAASTAHAELFKTGIEALITTIDKRLERQELQLTEELCSDIISTREEGRRFSNLAIPGEPNTQEMRELVSRHYTTVENNILQNPAINGREEIIPGDTPYATNFLYNYLFAVGMERNRETFEETLEEFRTIYGVITTQALEEVSTILIPALKTTIKYFDPKTLSDNPEFVISREYQTLISLYKAFNFINFKRFERDVPIINIRNLIDRTNIEFFDIHIELLNKQAQRYARSGHRTLEALTEQMLSLYELEEREHNLQQMAVFTSGNKPSETFSGEETEVAYRFNALIDYGKNFRELDNFFPRLKKYPQFKVNMGSPSLPKTRIAKMKTAAESITSQVKKARIERARSQESSINTMREELADKVFFRNTIFIHSSGESFPAESNAIPRKLGLTDLRIYPATDEETQERIFKVELIDHEQIITCTLDSEGTLDFGNPMLNQIPVCVHNRLALSILKCIDRVTESKETDNGIAANDTEWNPTPINRTRRRRRNHLMKLSQGKKPTVSQINLAWEEYGINILALERELRERGKLEPDQRITFRETDPEDDEVLVNN